MALLAGLGPQKPFRVVNVKLSPLLHGVRDTNRPDTLWDISIWRFDLMQRSRVRRNIFAELLYEEGVYNFGLVVGDLFVAKSLVKLQSMAARAICGEFRRCH